MIVFTGGSGRLGRALKPLFPDARFPDHQELDVLRPAAEPLIDASLIVHLAAIVGEKQCLRDRRLAWATNTIGTWNLLQTRIPMLYASTNEVFSGRKGGYRVTDQPDPLRFYGRTKAAAEQMVVDHGGKVFRFTMFARPFPWERAASDIFSSAGYVDEIVPIIARLIRTYQDIPAIKHVGNHRSSVLEIARRSRPDIERTTALELEQQTGLTMSRDTSFIDGEDIPCLKPQS